MKAIGYLGKIEKQLGVPVTTRNWNTAGWNGIVFIGSTNSTLYALDASTGTLLWSVLTGGAVNSTPVVADGVVYVGSADGSLYALDARSGDILWTGPTGGEVSSPAVWREKGLRRLGGRPAVCV